MQMPNINWNLITAIIVILALTGLLVWAFVPRNKKVQPTKAP